MGFAVSSRSLHDYGASVLGGGHTPYGYRDALGRIDARLSDRHALSATAFWNRESVRLNLARTDPDPGTAFVVPENATWGNHALVISYRGRVADITLDATASASGYQAELPLRPPPDAQTPAAGNDGLLAGAETGRLRLALDGSAPLGESRLRFGATLDRTETLYSARRFADIGTGIGVETEADGLAGGMYADGVRSLAPGLDLRVGLRADAFSTERGVRLAPRVAFLWSLSSEALLTVAAGRYHQFSRASDQQVDFTVSGGALTAPGGTLLSVATADHVAVSVDQALTDRVRLGIEGFWKEFTGLGASGGEVLHSSGVDLQVLHQARSGHSMARLQPVLVLVRGKWIRRNVELRRPAASQRRPERVARRAHRGRGERSVQRGPALHEHPVREQRRPGCHPFRSHRPSGRTGSRGPRILRTP